jgi:hypothetical protein
MRKSIIKPFQLILMLITINSCSIFDISEEVTLDQLLENFKTSYENRLLTFSGYPHARINNIKVDSTEKKISINFNRQFSYYPFRENEINLIYAETKDKLLPYSNEFVIEITSLGYDIKELVPNIYRENKTKYDKNRIPQSVERGNPVVFNLSKNLKPANGLFNKNVALWHSHGWYYNHKLDRWLWQRARLFQTVEDIGPISFTLPYIVPMLENAGANVFLPRERDTQTNEIIVDDLDSEFIDKNNLWITDSSTGFKMISSSIPANVNPFELGSYKYIVVNPVEVSAEYLPAFPEHGNYSVYISYRSVENSSQNVLYKVYHSGGISEFIVNQSIGGSTWIYLGNFQFEKGRNKKIGKVEISSVNSEKGEIITTDAVRFGGGMGVVERNGETSGRPKFVEGARYYLQYAGMPDTLVYNMNGNDDDYKDDYQSRGEWVNYLKGNPSGPNKNRTVKGLGIPIDASIAFHTDAGISTSDTTIGTLSIYTIEGMDTSSSFPENYSRLANRDFADILQSEIVNDIKTKYDPVWNRRQLMNAQYSESTRPNVPSVLLELASHQNFLDAKFMADPRFRFDVSRSIYKSVLKFLSVQHNFEYVVQPLPVTHFAISRKTGNSIELSWEPKLDPIEKSARPTGYIVYKSIGDEGFDNGTKTDLNFLELTNLEYDKIYNFKVTAFNNGGESFPSEILSCAFVNNNNPTVLIVNGFDRIAPPASVYTKEFSGFLNNVDQGVPYMYDMGFTGEQHNFNPDSKWSTDDIPGHGASYADFETKIVAGNTFNYPYIHGKAITLNGYSFISVSDEAITDGKINLSDFNIVDLIMGEEKTTNWTKPFSDSLLGLQYEVFDQKMITTISDYLENGGNLFISGSYLASDVFLSDTVDSIKVDFINKKLKFSLASDHAVKNGQVMSISETFLPKKYTFDFVTEMNDTIYNAEAPDALKPVNGGQTLLRYTENYFSAATGYNGDYSVVALGFPFETIKDERDRNKIMKAVINYFK